MSAYYATNQDFKMTANEESHAATSADHMGSQKARRKESGDRSDITSKAGSLHRYFSAVHDMEVKINEAFGMELSRLVLVCPSLVSRLTTFH